MKLIIDIDENLYNRIQTTKSVPDLCGTDIVNAITRIQNGKKRPNGEWLWLGDNPNRYNPNPNHKLSCNKCGRGVKEQENFCPNCGANMRGGADND